ncbi:cytoplasmic,Probable histidine--tRNA ligase [Trichinella spiralis]|uniref:Cytoplasmic,Probable histidine--tRNA ligase n=1 Tax=Trichinella spiralis TaxID=6334 RepID=A0ABR3KS58_TRISP
MLRLIDEPMWPVGVVEFRSKVNQARASSPIINYSCDSYGTIQKLQTGPTSRELVTCGCQMNVSLEDSLHSCSLLGDKHPKSGRQRLPSLPVIFAASPCIIAFRLYLSFTYSDRQVPSSEFPFSTYKTFHTGDVCRLSAGQFITRSGRIVCLKRKWKAVVLQKNGALNRRLLSLDNRRMRMQQKRKRPRLKCGATICGSLRHFIKQNKAQRNQALIRN